MSNRIRTLRVSSGLTQAALGEMLGVKKAAIQKYESGSIVNLKTQTIERLAEIFKVSPAHVMGWDTFDELFDSKSLNKESRIYSKIQEEFGSAGVELYKVLCSLNSEGLRRVLFYAEDIYLKYKK